ncbi:pilin [Vibrio sp. SCSIO 43137]|uniref:pilin n=1 Tax=Vibrio sp. SCSIO 43137 TaxID=3021011 RepID=UPI002306EF20|nr:prepilin-type N-terminal cleavage/methylation domain-containing protein [Vibrio sp. SCSIO 43137]WCE29229.1 prepilin-type N-terminal cleavage/methylation domain-containing protein [Vibrio sp. SCSIO 43137]
MCNKKRQGFTLIELMIVITIIGLLSTFAIPAYQSYLKKGEITSAMATLRALITPAEILYLEHGNLSGKNTLNDLGSSANANPLGTIAISKGNSLTFTFDKSNQFSKQSKLTYQRTATGWQCTRHKIETKLKGCPEQK